MKIENGTYTLTLTHGELEAMRSALGYSLDTLLELTAIADFDPEEQEKLKRDRDLVASMVEDLTRTLENSRVSY